MRATRITRLILGCPAGLLTSDTTSLRDAMTGLPSVLEQDCLRLRAPAPKDLPEIAAQIGDDRVARWLATVQQPFDMAAARALLDHGQHPGESLLLLEKQGSVIGGLCMGHALWYWLKPSLWGQGLMRRALTLAIAARFGRVAPPLIATCHEENRPSQVLLARLGFAPAPVGRRMFFHGTQRAEPCRDYILAPEQWHLLQPPTIIADRVTLRPATQKDAATLALMLPRAGTGCWPEADALPMFIEKRRFRGARSGLFVIADANRRSIGMAWISNRSQDVRFLTDTERVQHHAPVLAALEDWRSRDIRTD